jgi:outer membrane lipoprotein carrier protein
MFTAFIAALVVAATPPAQTKAATLSASQVVDEVQKYYANMQHLRTTFRQEYNNTTFGKKSVSDGELYIVKPGMMRWDYAKPEKKYFISDGTTLWVYEEANKQAFQQTLQNTVLPVAITFLYGKGNLKVEFTEALDPASGYGAAGDVVVKLTPRKASAQYKNLWLVLDPKDYHVKESVILEASNNINHFKFTKINLKYKAAAKFFKFTPPKGVKVVTPQPATGTPTGTGTGTGTGAPTDGAPQ